MSIEPPSKLAETADAILRQQDTSLEAFLAEAREHRAPYLRTAERLAEATSVQVSNETIRRWINHYEAANAGEAAA